MVTQLVSSRVSLSPGPSDPTLHMFSFLLGCPGGLRTEVLNGNEEERPGSVEKGVDEKE